MFASLRPRDTAPTPAASASRIARINAMKRYALPAAPSAGRAYESAGTMRARMLTLAVCGATGSGVIESLLRSRRLRRHVEFRLINRHVQLNLAERARGNGIADFD